MLKHLAILACLVLPTTVAADRIFFRELIVIPVRPIDANSFEVIEADGAGGMQNNHRLPLGQFRTEACNLGQAHGKVQLVAFGLTPTAKVNNGQPKRFAVD